MRRRRPRGGERGAARLCSDWVDEVTQIRCLIKHPSKSDTIHRGTVWNKYTAEATTLLQVQAQSAAVLHHLVDAMSPTVCRLSTSTASLFHPAQNRTQGTLDRPEFSQSLYMYHGAYVTTPMTDGRISASTVSPRVSHVSKHHVITRVRHGGRAVLSVGRRLTARCRSTTSAP